MADAATGTLEYVDLVIEEGVATITLNRPEVMNAWGKDLGRDLREVVEAVAADDAVRAVLITGAGRGFCSGADLKGGFDPAPDGKPDVQSALRERYHPVISAIRRMPKPVVAAVNGAAAGVGCSLALACDLVVAKDSAYFLLAFVNIGLMPDGGSTLLIPSRVGFTRAAEMALLGERVPARKALEWGLINRVHSDGAFAREVSELAKRLAVGPTQSYARSKVALNQWLYARMDEQLELEATLQQELARSDDFPEGVAAFLGKRPAEFKGA
jgi:2-(1,2-epoxy-1,2-dihydrophenyl)acetyl-CoA isomerase